MTQIELLRALIGGLLIGASAAILFLFNGRIAGVSGMIRGLSLKAGKRNADAWFFLGGLILGAGAFEAWAGELPVSRAHFPLWLLGLGGALVAVGTSWANGCTSGHGVCGLARLSVRSLTSVAIFLGVAIVTTYFIRHVWGIA